ncbi:uncharacterized protein TNCV_4295341 [Trichonephila clavipes]|uniref:XRN2-binding (XTBD) domain-containing protein n=1 Tax=Trichonephila clavipes TaxID=2585209 RepID=A0A8X6RLB1_TRICX|nr:uncharacterized protein TNCV_4295341 [Trichonephila clavipes]
MYQNNYPVDRLLCLAQAYSNIELLHCRYPEPVMHEVEQCSYNLKGNKKFQQMEADLEKKRKKKPELQARTGQRCMLNLSRAETSSRWCGVVIRRGVQAQVSSTSLDHGSKLHGPSPKALV